MNRYLPSRAFAQSIHLPCDAFQNAPLGLRRFVAAFDLVLVNRLAIFQFTRGR